MINAIRLAYASAVVASLAFTTEGKSEEAEIRLLCKPTASGGVFFNETTKAWEGTVFLPGEDGFILTNSFKGPNADRYEGFAFHAIPVGMNNATGGCETEANSSGRLTCFYSGQHLYVNLQTNRYLELYPHGYIDGEDNNDNTPFAKIGTCTRF
jgi:hypothetical protein